MLRGSRNNHNSGMPNAWGFYSRDLQSMFTMPNVLQLSGWSGAEGRFYGQTAVCLIRTKDCFQPKADIVNLHLWGNRTFAATESCSDMSGNSRPSR